MLRSTKEIEGFTIVASDGPLGSVDEFFFDDDSWVIRYAVVNTGSWLFGKKVLLPPLLFRCPDWKNYCLPVKLTKEQVRNSPDIDTEKPVSRQQELNLHKFFGWMPYWDSSALGAVPTPIMNSSQSTTESISAPTPEQDSHLRRTKEVFGYRIKTRNGEIGHLNDFLLHEDLRLIRYAAVEIRSLFSIKKVLLSKDWIKSISWNDQTLYLDLDREFVKNSPEFNPANPVDREFEARLHDYYGRSKYWF
jgi:hypothetical protein